MELNRHQHEPVRCVAFILLLAAMMWIAGCDGHRNQKTGPGTVPEVKTVTPPVDTGRADHRAPGANNCLWRGTNPASGQRYNPEAAVQGGS